MTAEKLKELEGLGAQKALEILQGHLVQFLKEKMRGEGGGRGRGRGRRGRGRGGGRGGGNGGSKEESRPGVGAADVAQPLMKSVEGQEGAPPVIEGDNSSIQTLSRNLANEQPQTNGVEGSIEGRSMKKRKVDTEALDVDVDIDVIGP